MFCGLADQLLSSSHSAWSVGPRRTGYEPHKQILMHKYKTAVIDACKSDGVLP